MFDNIGSKIKNLAAAVTAFGIMFSVVGGFILMFTDEELILSGFLVMAFGSLGSWLSSLTLYGFGQLIENSDILVKQGRGEFPHFQGEDSTLDDTPIQEEAQPEKSEEEKRADRTLYIVVGALVLIMVFIVFTVAVGA